jgi:ribosome biogenesis protein BMS1
VIQSIDRAPRKFNPLKVPRKLQAVLPYASKPKVMKPQKHQTYMQKRAVVMEPEERKAVAMMQQIRALRKDQITRRKERKHQKNVEHREKVLREEGKREDKDKEKRKEYMREAGMKSKRDEERDMGKRPKKRAKH